MNMGGMGPLDLMKLVSQAGKIRENMGQLKDKAAKRTVEGAAGGGLVKVTVNGAGEVLSVTVDPEALQDPEALGPLVAAAVNDGLRKSKEVLLEETKAAMGGLDLPPGMMDGLGV